MKRKLTAIALLVAMLASMFSVGMVAMAEGIEPHDDEDHIANTGGWSCIETVTERGDTPECGEHICGESEPCVPTSCLNPDHKGSDDCDANQEECVFNCSLDTGHTHADECYPIISSTWTCTPPAATFACSFVHEYEYGATVNEDLNLTAAEIANPLGYAKPLAYEGKYYSLTETDIDGNEVDGYTVTMTYAYEEITIPILKLWWDRFDLAALRPDFIDVVAYDITDTEFSTILGTTRLYPPENTTGLEGDALLMFLLQWSGPITLPKYDLSGNIISYIFVDDAGSGYNCIPGTPMNDYTVENELNKENVPIAECVVAKKVWNDNNNANGNRPDEISLYIVNQDGKQIGTKIKLSGDEHASEWWFTLFFPTAVDGVTQVYTLMEEPIPGYNFTTYSPTTEGATFFLTESGKNHDYLETAIVTGTNTPRGDTPDPEYVSLKVKKTWDNSVPANMLPDSIVFQLLANGQTVTGQTRTLTETGGWENSFNGLAKYDNSNNLIDYSVVELDPGSFTPRYGTVSKNGNFYEVTVTNSYRDDPNPEYVSLRVFKAWDIDNAPDTIVIPQSIAVQLYANGEPVSGRIITITMDNWQGSFTGLPKYDSSNNLIEYSVVELDPGVFTPENGEITVNGNTYEIVITNIYIDDPDTPLGPAPTPTPDTGGDTTIEDGEVPLADSPRTADDINPLTSWILLAASLFGMGIVLVSTKRKVRK